MENMQGLNKKIQGRMGICFIELRRYLQRRDRGWEDEMGFDQGACKGKLLTAHCWTPKSWWARSTLPYRDCILVLWPWGTRRLDDWFQGLLPSRTQTSHLMGVICGHFAYWEIVLYLWFFICEGLIIPVQSESRTKMKNSAAKETAPRILWWDMNKFTTDCHGGFSAITVS